MIYVCRKSNASPDGPGGSSITRRSMPRKTAMAMNISHAVDKGDEQFEEMQHSDGKVGCHNVLPGST